MRWLLTPALVLAAAGHAPAQDAEAEKLFRAMEQKVRGAKTLHLRFDLTITDAAGKKGAVKGSLTLGEGDRFRAEAAGTLFGEAVKFTEVSDGTRMVAVGDANRAVGAKEDSPKGIGAYCRTALPREGFFLCTVNVGRRAGLTADDFTLSGFALGGKVKVGDRDTRAVRYRVTPKGGDPLSMTVWLDARTGLPAKLTMSGGGADIASLTETYAEFTLDGKIDPKRFEVPK